MSVLLEAPLDGLVAFDGRPVLGAQTAAHVGRRGRSEENPENEKRREKATQEETTEEEESVEIGDEII